MAILVWLLFDWFCNMKDTLDAALCSRASASYIVISTGPQPHSSSKSAEDASLVDLQPCEACVSAGRLASFGSACLNFGDLHECADLLIVGFLDLQKYVLGGRCTYNCGPNLE